MVAIIYYKGAELPNVEVTWLDAGGVAVNFSTGYTFTVKIGNAGSAALVTKTSGITGLSSTPNLIISWSAAELDTLSPGTYDMDIIARETATSKDRIQSTEITILAAVT